MILLAENVAFGTSARMKATFYYEKQRSGSTMQYRIKTVITMPSTSSFGYNINQKITIDGEIKETHQIKANSPSKWTNQEYTTGWFDVTNKTSGTTSLVINLSSNSGLNTNYNYSMGVDPAYTSITLFGVYDQTETSITYSWETADIISKLEYSFNGTTWTTYSSSLNTKNGKFTITGLTADTSYNMYIRVTRKDSGLQTTSNKLTESTLRNPCCWFVSNFNVGEKFRIGLFNVLERTIKIYLLPEGEEQIFLFETSDSQMNYEIDSSLYANSLKQSCIDNPNKKYSILVKCEAINTNMTYGTGTYTIPNSPPTFTNFEYEDSQSDVVLITENNQEIVKNKSILKVKISSQNKMIAKDYANPIRYEISCANRTKSANYSEEDVEVELGTINSSGIMNIVVKAIDSRGFTTTINKTISVIDYNNIVQNNDIYRINNFENTTKLKCEGTFSLVEIDGVIKNTIEDIKYRYKETGGEYPTTYTSITPNLNGNKYSSVLQTFELDNQKSFMFEILVKDKFGWSIPVELIVDEGVPIMYINADKKNFGVGCINEHEEYSLEVKNNLYLDGDKIEFNSQDLFTIENEKIKVGNWLSIYPVGSIYLSVNNTNPKNLFGGTWERFGNGRVLVGVDENDSSFNTVKKTGGHKELQSHNHSFSGSASTASLTGKMGEIYSGTNVNREGIVSGKVDGIDRAYSIASSGSSSNKWATWNFDASHSHTLSGTIGNTGNGNAGNLQPYITCYMWLRTA